MAERFDVVAIRIEDEGPKVGQWYSGRRPGLPLSHPTAAMAAPLATSSANLREPCMRSSRMPLHGRAGEVSVGAVVAAARKDPGERRRSVARFRRLQRPAYWRGQQANG